VERLEEVRCQIAEERRKHDIRVTLERRRPIEAPPELEEKRVLLFGQSQSKVHCVRTIKRELRGR
jgi:hypothetical protein